MRYLNLAAAIFALAVVSSTATAQPYDVLIEPLVAAKSGGSTVSIFKGTLVEPSYIILKSADDKTAGQRLDLAKVLVIFFPTERIAALDKLITTKKADLEKETDATKKKTLAKEIVTLGTEKAQLSINGTKVVTSYKTGLFNGTLDETKYKVKFQIEIKPSGSDVADPPTEYTQEQLKAIYILGPTPPAATPATTGRKLDGMDDTRGDAWTAVARLLDDVNNERTRLADQFTRLKKQRGLIAFGSPESDLWFQPMTKGDVLARIDVQLDALRNSVHAKDLLIEAYQLQLAYLPRPKSAPNAGQPFWQEPKITAIKPGEDCCKLDDSCSLEKCAKDAKLRTWSYRFKGAANFPQPQFDIDGERVNAPGSVIYQGMQLVVASDGRYEVAFTASTPRVPVTLRLDLGVLVAGHDPICLTLPAIAMVPDYRSAEENAASAYRILSNNYQQNFAVRHIGYAPELSEAVAQMGGIADVHRDGVARFGSLPLSR